MIAALGVDLKAGGVSIARVTDDGSGPRFVRSREWFARPPRSGERVQVIERLYRVGVIARAILRDLGRDGCDAIFVEDPKGRHRAPTLVAAYGVVLASAYEVALDLQGGATVFTENARTWRRGAGCLSAKGEDPKAGALRLAAAVGCPDSASEDEKEAVSMAVRALKVIR